MKYFTAEVKIAITAIIAVVLLFIGMNFLKGINLFKTSNSYNVEFTNIAGLTVSAPVYADGYAIGIVRDINYNYDHPGHVVVDVELDKEMRVPEGTTAELESEMLGSVKMNLILSKNPLKHINPGDTIYGHEHIGVLNKVETMVPGIEKMLPKLDSILCSLNKLLADPALAATLHNARDITANLKQSTVQLNSILGNDIPRLTNHLDRIGTNTEQITDNLKKVDVAATMASINATVENSNKMISSINKQINSKDNSLGLLLNDRSMYDSINTTVNSANGLLIDLKSHPKRYVHFSIFGKKDK